MRFSDGGRIELNGGECAGEYAINAIDGNVGSVDSGYIECPPIMDGYIRDATVTVEGDTLTISGPVINGTYHKD